MVRSIVVKLHVLPRSAKELDELSPYACPWYLECNFGITPPKEEAFFQVLKDSVMVDPKVPEFSGLDNVAKTKAVKRRELSDRKKIEKLDEAKRRTKENEQKTLSVRLEKKKEKESKKGTKRKANN